MGWDPRAPVYDQSFGRRNSNNTLGLSQTAQYPYAEHRKSLPGAFSDYAGLEYPAGGKRSFDPTLISPFGAGGNIQPPLSPGGSLNPYANTDSRRSVNATMPLSAPTSSNDKKMRMLMQQQMMAREQMMMRGRNSDYANGGPPSPTTMGYGSGQGGPGSPVHGRRIHQSSPPPTLDPAHGMRSPLLEEFRNNKNKKYELRVSVV